MESEKWPSRQVCPFLLNVVPGTLNSDYRCDYQLLSLSNDQIAFFWWARNAFER